MSAELSISNGNNPDYVQVKAKTLLPSPKIASNLISTESLPKSNKGKFVIPVEKLTAVQMQELINLPGAYLISDESSTSNGNPAVEPLALCEQEPNSQSYKHRFLVKHSNKFLSIEVEQIAYFYAENRLNFIKTWNSKTYIIDKTIEEISGILNKRDFFRVNRSYIISYKSIEEVYTHFNNRLKLKLNTPVIEEVFVSKDRVAKFKEWLGG